MTKRLADADCAFLVACAPLSWSPARPERPDSPSPQRFLAALADFAGATGLAGAAGLAAAFVGRTAFTGEATLAAAAFDEDATFDALDRPLVAGAGAAAFFAAADRALVLSASLKADAGLKATDFDAGTFTVAWV